MGRQPRDGAWLATGGKDGTVRICKASTGELPRTLSGPTDQVNTVAISADGKWLGHRMSRSCSPRLGPLRGPTPADTPGPRRHSAGRGYQP
ncbi:WD40 repeat domain-containing protein [Streptomyces sp. NPDC060035]|uniref:WD40 repeat domain-containing protein n=1 Tax=Streptomyces sp. NPDC060035 TaxID=3347044 RepID=UPI0036C67BD9